MHQWRSQPKSMEISKPKSLRRGNEAEAGVERSKSAIVEAGAVHKMLILIAVIGAIPIDPDLLDVNFRNKSAIVEAGAVHKMLDLIESPIQGSPNPDLSAAIVASYCYGEDDVLAPLSTLY
ncbi:hypothetical protein LXL04_019682 [Taraxacum kok-saghyz]